MNKEYAAFLDEASKTTNGDMFVKLISTKFGLTESESHTVLAEWTLNNLQKPILLEE